MHLALKPLHLLATCISVCTPAIAATLEVGTGKPFASIESALAAAHEGDTIRVHALAAGQAYERVALRIRTPNLQIIAVPDKPGEAVRLSGAGFDYSGAGSVPRAIVQFEPQADGCVLEGFDLFAAHNASHNGAGVRINQANHTTVRACTIHDNDMGIMSSGDGTPATAIDQRIERCLIYSNGAPKEPGFSHNLYLGGTSVVVSGCEIRASLCGHNVKSRAHYTRVEYCWVHDAMDREFDLVDAAGDTDVPGSDAVILGCIVDKRKESAGNRTMIHFGQDGGREHTGRLFLVNNTMLTYYVSPLVDISAAGVSEVLFANNIISSGGAKGTLLGVRSKNPKSLPKVTGSRNAFDSAFEGASKLGAIVSGLKSVDAARGDYRVVPDVARQLEHGVAIQALNLPGATGRDKDTPGAPLLQYRDPRMSVPREKQEEPEIGAVSQK